MNDSKGPMLIALAVLETVVESSEGAPGGTLYAALMTYGISFEGFTNLMGGLVNSGLVTKSGQLYFASDKGKALVEQVNKAKVAA